MMSVSVCLSVTFVHCGHRVQWIPDTLHAWIDECLLFTDNALPSDGIMPGWKRWKRGGVISSYPSHC